MSDFWIYFIFACAVFAMWQLMWFFFFDCGRIQKWRLRKSIDVVAKYIKYNTKQGTPPAQFTFLYKNKEFKVSIVETEVNWHYRNYQISINGEHVATYHCLKHMFLNSYCLESTSHRDMGEVTRLLQVAKKRINKLEQETVEKKTPFWQENSYFN